MKPKPCHVLVEPGDRRAACGLRYVKEGTGWWRWTDAHRANYFLHICADCALAFDRLDWVGPPDHEWHKQCAEVIDEMAVPT